MINLVVAAILSLLIVSCTKARIEKCRANCANIIISGQVWDSSNRKGLAKIPVKVYWQDAGICYLCPENVIAVFKTDDQGRFSLDMAIDSSLFHGNRLRISATMPGGYIANGSHNGFLEKSFIQYRQFYKNLKFTMYQAANLNIKLQRAQTDNFIIFELDYVFDFTRLGIYYYNGSAPVSVSSFNVVTGSGVFTKISWRKVHGVGMFSTFVDSIQCLANTNNSIILNY